MSPLFTHFELGAFGYVGYICRRHGPHLVMGRPVHTTGSRRSVRRAIKRELAWCRSRLDVFAKGNPVDCRLDRG